MRVSQAIQRARVRLSDESGVVMIIALALTVVLGIIATTVMVTAVASNRSSLGDQRFTQAQAAAVGGLRTALYRLNTNIPADGSCLPTAAGVPVTPNSDGVCGPYSSTDTGAVQPSPGSQFSYWVTPVLGTSGVPDTCTGASLAPPGLPTSVVKERCVTAMGQSIGPGGQITATRRVQARLSATGQLFIIPGIWGTDSVKVGQGQSTANIIGALGSNGLGVAQSGGNTWDIDLNARSWGDSANPRTVGGHTYYMGGDVYFGRAAGTTPSASLIYTATSITDATTFPPTTVTCTACPTGGSSNTTQVSAISALTVPDSNAAHPIDLGRRVPLSPVGPIFTSPPPPVLGVAGSSSTALPGSTAATPIYGGATRPAGQPATSHACLDSPPAVAGTAPCDTSRRNDNAFGISSNGCQGTPYNAGNGSATDTRTLTLAPARNGPGTCTVTLQNGVYNFCNIDYSSNSSIVPADTSGTAEVYIFIDSNTRSVLPTSAGGSTTNACKNGISGVGNITTPNGAGSVTSFMNTAATSLAGQLYFWGAGDSATSGNGTTTAVSHNVVIPNGWQFKGLVFAPNSNVNLKPNVTLQGGLAARTVTVDNGATYVWDVGVDLVDANVGRRTFYRVLFKQCNPNIPVVAGVARPGDGC